MKIRTTMAALAALAWLLQATPARSQSRPQEPPTIEEAIEELEQEQHGGYWPHRPAVYILRQVVSGWGDPYPRPAAELDAFADRLAAIVADATLPDHVRRNARNALRGAADLKTGPGVQGTPYPRGFDLLVQVFEGGYDDALYSIWLADSVRGRAYLQDVFERLDPPPMCGKRLDSSREEWARPDPPECAGKSDIAYHLTTWCRAGRTLFREVVAAAREFDDGWLGGAGDAHSAVPEGLPEHIEDWYRRCSS
ncbi:MAG: hypothetical protein OXG58_00840 [Gemmatimonadetes bacterium]|nr:hypothetical protein [Gemmatimonadota bacterium]MCY3944518.1 hypothetical protein [Gemmatimonadota bacterium]